MGSAFAGPVSGRNTVMEKLSERWLLQTHDRAALGRWVRGLRYFRFVRAWGGHANDGDSFVAWVRFADRPDLYTKLNQLGVVLHTIPANAPQPEVGRAYTAEEFEQFPVTVQSQPGLEQPGHIKIAGQPVFVWIGEQHIELSVSGMKDGNRYEVSEADFDAARVLEAEFDRLGWPSAYFQDNTESVCWVTPQRYPELFT